MTEARAGASQSSSISLVTLIASVSGALLLGLLVGGVVAAAMTASLLAPSGALHHFEEAPGAAGIVTINTRVTAGDGSTYLTSKVSDLVSLDGQQIAKSALFNFKASGPINVTGVFSEHQGMKVGAAMIEDDDGNHYFVIPASGGPPQRLIIAPLDPATP